jgi:sugar phosphate isomerase/epimerase
MIHEKREVLPDKISRNEFLKTSSAGIMGAAILPEVILSGCSSATTASPAKIGLQLYTLRDQIKTDIKGTLRRLSEIGFAGIETAFWPEGISVADAGKLLKEFGLSVCSSHIELPLNEQKAKVLEIAETFECKRMIWHGWPEDVRYKTLDGIKQLAEVYNQSNQVAKSNGLQFGLHNHWWEFMDKIEGRYALQVLKDYIDEDIFFEIDTYWVKVAGFDPAKIVGDLGKRAPLLHIKDGPARWTDSIATNPEPMLAVGKGTQNFPAIAKASNGNTEWMIVEMDHTTGDVFTAIQDSFNYLTQNKLAVGK